MLLNLRNFETKKQRNFETFVFSFKAIPPPLTIPTPTPAPALAGVCRCQSAVPGRIAGLRVPCACSRVRVPVCGFLCAGFHTLPRPANQTRKPKEYKIRAEKCFKLVWSDVENLYFRRLETHLVLFFWY